MPREGVGREGESNGRRVEGRKAEIVMERGRGERDEGKENYLETEDQNLRSSSTTFYTHKYT